MKKVLAIGLTERNLKEILNLGSSGNFQITILALGEGFSEHMFDATDFDSSSIQIKDIQDYSGLIDPEAFYTSLANDCLKGLEEILGFIGAEYPASAYRGISLLKLVDQNIRTRYIWPSYQRIYIIKQILEFERPDEVWVCSDHRWSFTVYEPSTIPLVEWLETRAMEYDAIIRVAHSQDIAVRYLRQGWDGWRRYLFTRFFRRWVLKYYKQAHLLFSKISKALEVYRFQNKDERPLILALVRSPVHEKRLYPVLEELTRQGWRAMVVEDYSLAVRTRERIVKTEFEVVNFNKWRSWRFNRHAKSVKEFRQWLMHGQAKFPQITFQDVDVTDLFISVIYSLADWFAEAAGLVDDSSRLISKIQPDMLLLANDQSASSKALVNLCQHRGIPTLTIQHGLVANPPIPNIPVATDHYAVMGDMAADLFIQYGTHPEKITITGIPGWKFQTGVQVQTGKEGVGCVTLITQTEPNISSSFHQTARKMPDVEFVIRPSPRESASIYNYSLPNLSVCQDESLEDILARTDLVIGVNSTALFEAILMGIPVLVAEVFLQSENPFLPGVKTIPRVGDWSPTIRECLQDLRLRQEMLERQNQHMKYLGIQDGRAVERIISLILDIVNGV